MDDRSASLEMLNLYEVQDEGRPRHFVCFLEPVLAGARGIPGHAIVGEFAPGASGEFDPGTFELNPEFVAAFTGFMNDRAIRSSELVRQARANPGGWLYLIDPRNRTPADDPPPGDLLGAFAIDDSGQAVPNSFQYNRNHVMFDPTSGPSGILMDRQFYDWLHSEGPESDPT